MRRPVGVVERHAVRAHLRRDRVEHEPAGGEDHARPPLLRRGGAPLDQRRDAAAITALQLLWPALQRLEGAEIQVVPRLKVRLETPLRRASGRPELARARMVVGPEGELCARVEGTQASSRIGSLQGADLLLEIPADQGDLEVGAELWAQLLRLPVF